MNFKMKIAKTIVFEGLYELRTLKPGHSTQELLVSLMEGGIE